jgi:hypothetical protein
MGNYGRNFEVVTMPPAPSRQNYCAPTTGDPIPLGTPVEVNTAAAVNALNLQPIKKSAADEPRTNQGQGVLLYEYAPAAFAGTDPNLTLYSDLDTAPLGAAVQVIHGGGIGIQILLRNTADSVFLENRTYTGRTMVAGLGGATPTIVVGDYLTPSGGDDTTGWWKETSTEANAWLRVVSVDNDRSELVAELLV